MTPKDPLDRRDFLKRASVVGLGALAAGRGSRPLFALEGSPAERLNVAVMGLTGRGMFHAHALGAGKNTPLAYLCDFASTVLAKALGDVAKLRAPPPKTVTDFRRILDDKSVDALVIA